MQAFPDRRPSTARNAFVYGYNVVLVVDAMTDRNLDAHRLSVETLFPRIGETITTDDVLAQLKARVDGAGRGPLAAAPVRPARWAGRLKAESPDFRGR